MTGRLGVRVASRGSHLPSLIKVTKQINADCVKAFADVAGVDWNAFGVKAPTAALQAA